MAISKTPTPSGQLLLFNFDCYSQTTSTGTLGEQIYEESSTSTNLTSNLRTRNQRIRIRCHPKQPSPRMSGQPTDAWAFPNFDLMVDNRSVLNSTYLKFVKRLQDGSAQDPASDLGLKVHEIMLVNYNTATNQPQTTPGDIWYEVIMDIVKLSDASVVTDLDYSRFYDFELAPELLFEWYNF